MLATTISIRSLRTQLGLARSEFARFFGVSEATVVRWESDVGISEPRGLQALLLRAVADCVAQRSAAYCAQVMRSSALDHRSALQALLAAAG